MQGGSCVYPAWGGVPAGRAGVHPREEHPMHVLLAARALPCSHTATRTPTAAKIELIGYTSHLGLHQTLSDPDRRPVGWAQLRRSEWARGAGLVARAVPSGSWAQGGDPPRRGRTAGSPGILRTFLLSFWLLFGSDRALHYTPIPASNPQRLGGELPSALHREGT